ncbi:hypothetical protein FXO37_33629 [Capsicum annuum]|nr:hypothetical protein FXO37_33629 [Capsicum annuum]
MQFTPASEKDEQTRRDARTQRDSKIRRSSWVSYDAYKMVSTHAHVFNNPAPVFVHYDDWHDDLALNLEGSPQLSRHQSKKAIREARASEKDMTCLDDPQNDLEGFPRSAFSTGKGIFEDIFISQPHPFISRQPPDANDDLYVNEYVKNDEDVLQQSIQLPKEDCPSMLEKHSSKLVVFQLVFKKYKLTSDPVPERRQEQIIEVEKIIDVTSSLPQDLKTFRMIKNLVERGKYMILPDYTPRRLKLPRPPKDESKVVNQTRYFRRSSPADYKKKIDSFFICRKPGHFAKDFSHLKKSKDIVHLFEEIANHVGIYLDKEDDLESVFSLEKELTEDTIIFIDIYDESGDIYANDLYLISSTREDSQKLAN